MDQNIYAYLPSKAHGHVTALLDKYPIEIKIVKARKTKHGDFKKQSDGKVKISLNAHPNPFRFLITFLHEMAHHVAFQNEGFSIRPHGKEWKKHYRLLAFPFLKDHILPAPLHRVFSSHMENPKASSLSDIHLAKTLLSYDPPTSKIPIFELEEGARFALENGRQFEKGLQRTKRFLCTELGSQKVYLFHPVAEVIPL